MEEGLLAVHGDVDVFGDGIGGWKWKRVKKKISWRSISKSHRFYPS